MGPSHQVLPTDELEMCLSTQILLMATGELYTWRISAGFQRPGLACETFVFVLFPKMFKSWSDGAAKISGWCSFVCAEVAMLKVWWLLCVVVGNMQACAPVKPHTSYKFRVDSSSALSVWFACFSLRLRGFSPGTLVYLHPTYHKHAPLNCPRCVHLCVCVWVNGNTIITY